MQWAWGTRPVSGRHRLNGLETSRVRVLTGAGTCDQTQAPGRCPQTQLGKLRPITLNPHTLVSGTPRKERHSRREGLCQPLLRGMRRLERKGGKGCDVGEQLLQLLQANMPLLCCKSDVITPILTEEGGAPAPLSTEEAEGPGLELGTLARKHLKASGRGQHRTR